MKEMKYNDFIPMVATAAERAMVSEVFDSIGDVEITLQDEEGTEYYIQDVVFDRDSGTVTLRFTHDND